MKYLFLLAVLLSAFTFTAQAQTTAAEWLASGDALYKANKFSEAMSAYSKAIGLDPKLAAAYVNRGRTRILTGDKTGAIADATKAIELMPGDPFNYYLRGFYLESNSDDEGALKDFEKTISLEPKAAPAYLGRARIRIRWEEYAEAEADATKAISLAPQNAEGYSLRTWIRTEVKNIPGALADANKAVELKPKDVDNYVQRASLRAETNDPAGAAADITAAMQLDPKNTSFLNLRARYYRMAGKGSLAVADLKTRYGVGAAKPMSESMKYDEVPRLRPSDMEFRLQELAMAMTNIYTKETLYVIVYGGRRGGLSQGKELIGQVRSILEGLEVPKTRIVTIDGGFRDDALIEYWVVPAGGRIPDVSPTVDPSEVN